VVVASVAAGATAVIMVAAVRTALPEVGVEDRAVDMVFPDVVQVAADMAPQGVDRKAAVAIADSVIVDLVVGGKADPAAGSANGVVADPAAGSAAVLRAARADPRSADSVVGVRWAAGLSSAAATAGPASAAKPAIFVQAIGSRAIGSRAIVVVESPASVARAVADLASPDSAAPDHGAALHVKPVREVLASEPPAVVADRKAMLMAIKPPAIVRPVGRAATKPVPAAVAIAALQTAALQTAALQTVAVQIVAVQIVVVRVLNVVVRPVPAVAHRDPSAVSGAMRLTPLISFSRSCSDSLSASCQLGAAIPRRRMPQWPPAPFYFAASRFWSE
jgi:hypothetical protein